MNVVTTFIAHRQAAQPGHPGVGALHDPSVAAKALAAVVVLACDAGLDAPLAAFRPAAAAIIGFVGMELVRAAARPRLPERTPGMASGVVASAMLSWRLAPVRVTPSGVPRPSTTRWRFVPGLPRSVGMDPFSAPLFGGNAGAVQRSPAPIQLTSLVKALQQHTVQGRPHACLLPFVQPAPTGHARAAVHLPGQVLQGQPRLEHKQNTGERRPVRHRRTRPPLGCGRTGSAAIYATSSTWLVTSPNARSD